MAQGCWVAKCSVYHHYCTELAGRARQAVVLSRSLPDPVLLYRSRCVLDKSFPCWLVRFRPLGLQLHFFAPHLAVGHFCPRSVALVPPAVFQVLVLPFSVPPVGLKPLRALAVAQPVPQTHLAGAQQVPAHLDPVAVPLTFCSN